MNKVICDVCGTMYPDNASQCPICGCAKSANNEVIPADGTQSDNAAGEYNYTKGGHFSKSNVRRRSKAAERAPKAAAVMDADDEDSEQEDTSSQSNKGLIIAIVLLIVAIVGMLCYIFFTYFADDLFGGATEPASTISTTTEATQTDFVEIKCEGLDLQVPNDEIVLEKVGHAWLLKIATSPADTTDEITYTTSNPSVATVSSEGRVTAVGGGTAIITVKCGDVVKECKVVCNFGTEPTEETVEETTEATEPTEETTEPTTKPTEPEVDVSKFYLFPRRDGDCTINVDESGRRLNQDFLFRRSERIRKDLERKYGLHPAERRGERIERPLRKADTSAGNIKKQVSNIVKAVNRQYRFQSLGEYRALLSLYNVTVEEARGIVRGREYHGLVFSATDDAGNKTGSRNASKMQFKLNISNINFGMVVHLWNKKKMNRIK